MKLTESGVAHLGRPGPVYLVADEPLETGIGLIFGIRGGDWARTEICGIELNARVAHPKARVPIGVRGIRRTRARQQQCCDRAAHSRVFHRAGPFLPLECPEPV